MMELLRNCSHDNESATYIVSETVSKKIIKIADTAVGIATLEREIDGWEWYCHLRYPSRKSFCRVVQKNISYLKIEIDFIRGVKNDYRKGLSGNSDILKKAMSHYRDIWPYYSDGHSELHGDLSVDNIIFNEDGIHVIDWEYFNRQCGPWGFDALYLLFETLYFSMRMPRHPSQREIEIIVESINILNSRKQLSKDFMQGPLKAVKNFILSSFKCWGEHLITPPRKLPVVLFTDEQVSLIDRAIVNRIKG